MAPIRVAVVDDSAFTRAVLARIMSEADDIDVVGLAESGEELLQHISEWNPDVITMDLQMPGMGGLAALERVMKEHATQVIILSASAVAGAAATLEALDLGAADFIDKGAHSMMDFGPLRDTLFLKIRALAAKPSAKETHERPGPTAQAGPPADKRIYDAVLIGASTGGPRAVEQVLSKMSTPFPVPVVIVQHMPLGFTQPFAERLDRKLSMTVEEAGHDASLLPGTVYIGPSGKHIRIRRNGSVLFSTLSGSPKKGPHMPSVDELFASGADALGDAGIAVLLTGMGRDGAEGMRKLAKADAYTIAQDARSSVIYGMPRAAVELNAVKESLPLTRIGARLSDLVSATTAIV